ncbi:unnamed protein product [Rotaria magnacalcarata]|uniref:Poly [ADP-ribose] polymerase n=3 Tax=Rotaria magnacalcarata TaxID=392030 RepID=A0A818YPV5_9BILA|nr:unnamed protein product [Rotaria magnacalcarata]
MSSKKSYVPVNMVRILWSEENSPITHYNNVTVVMAKDSRDNIKYFCIVEQQKTIFSEELNRLEWLDESSAHGVAAISGPSMKIVILYDTQSSDSCKFFDELKVSLQQARNTRPSSFVTQAEPIIQPVLPSPIAFDRTLVTFDLDHSTDGNDYESDSSFRSECAPPDYQVDHESFDLKFQRLKLSELGMDSSINANDDNYPSDYQRIPDSRNVVAPRGKTLIPTFQRTPIYSHPSQPELFRPRSSHFRTFRPSPVDCNLNQVTPRNTNRFRSSSIPENIFPLISTRCDSVESISTDADLHQPVPIRRRSKTPTGTNSAHLLINICKGDLITQQTDVIVVCSSSQYLFKNICKAGGGSVSNSYDEQIRKNSAAPIVTVQSNGRIASKSIYFLPWKTNSDASILCKSIKNFVSVALDKAIEENYRSIAFPAIGCGKMHCSIGLVARAMIEEVYRKLQLNDLSVTFVVQPDKKDVYAEFQKQINSLARQSLPTTGKTRCATFGKGVIEIEMGDITTQNVDAIIGSSSSDILKEKIIKAAGKQCQSAYNTELENRPHSILIAIPPGALPCKQILFVKWKPDKDDKILQQSLVDLISIVVQNVISYKFTTFAFPAIGCGQHGCSVDIVVKTMVREMKNHLVQRDLAWRVKFVVQPNQENVYDEFCTQLLTTQDGFHEPIVSELPPTWEKSTEQRTLFVLPTKTDEYNSIATNFNNVMTGKYTDIIKIERIQNERWYMQYLAHSKDFLKRLNTDTEKRLYHGCSQQAANSIIEDCFNRSFAGVNGTSYGFGVYFSSRAAYSHDYAKNNANGERCMFLARVLVGKTTRGNNSMKTRPLGFDSTTDGNHIFVTYHDAQAFAEYLITYK